MIGSAGGVTYFQITISPAGLLSLSQSYAIWHPDSSSKDDSVLLNLADADLLQVQQIVTDFDGDQAFGNLNIGQGIFVFEDDGPVASVVDDQFSRREVEGSLDESELAGTMPASGQGDGVYSTTLDVSVAFSAPGGSIGTVGTDLPGVTESYGLVLSGESISSGLNLLNGSDASLPGNAIVLVSGSGADAGKVFGVELGNESNEVFVISVDSSTGVVTFAYSDTTNPDNIYHANTGSNDEEIFLNTGEGGSLLVKQTIIDQDGDSVTSTGGVNLGNGSLLGIQDDGPSGGIALKTVTLVTDETAGVNTLSNGGTETAPVVGGVQSLGQSSVTYANLVTDSFGFGTDGAAAGGGGRTFDLVVTDGTASGYWTPDHSQQIYLYENGTVIEGRVGAGGVASPTGAVAFTVAVNSTGDVTLTQFLAVEHTPNSTNDQTSLSLSANVLSLEATATDKDGDSLTDSVDLGSIIRFEDDGPTIQSSNSTSTVTIDAPYTSTPGSPIVYNNVNIGNWIFGTDGPSGSQSVTVTGLPAGYTATTPVLSGSLITFSLSYQGTKVADFEINSANGNDDKLTIYQVPGQIVTSNIDGDAAKAGGPGIYYVELVVADIVAVVTGIKSDGTAGSVNASNQGWAGGDGDQNMEDGEKINFAFKDYDPTLPNNTGGNDFVQSFSFDAQKFTGGGNNPTLSITVTYSDGSTHAFANVTIPNGLTTYPFAVDSTGLYVNGVLAQAYASSAAGIQSVDILDVVDGSQTFNINGVKIGSISDVRPDLNPTFTLTLKDGDSDTSSLNVNLKLDGNDVGGPTVLGITTSPIALDANNDGQIIYQALATSTANFDYAGDGYAEQTAWVAAGDALLVYDHNGDRVANDGLEISFIQYNPDARTDLEGLSLAFDSNYDGVFDVNDARFADFGIWTDFNADAKTDAGEFQTLIESGITSINLTSDGQLVSAADGDVLVHGSTTYSYADGTTGLAQDVTFTASLAPSGSASDPTPGSGSEPVYPVAESLDPATDTFAQDVVVPEKDIAVADLLDQFMVENTVRDSTVVEYQQEFMLNADDSIDDVNLYPSFTEPTAEAIAALDEADFITSDDAAAGLDHAADVVDDFSYTV